jgi:opacity protein-like surface antigen
VFFAPRDEEDDFITTVSPGLELVNRTERLDLGVQGRFNWLKYEENDDLTTWNWLFDGNLRYRVTQRMTISADAIYEKDSRPDRDISDTGLILNTSDRESHRYGAGAEYEWSQITRSDVAYSYQQANYDDPQLTDAQWHDVDLGVTHDLNYVIPRLNGRATLGYEHYDFDGSRMENCRGSVGIIYELTHLLSLTADIGARYSTPDFEAGATRADDDDTWGPLGQLRLSYEGRYDAASLWVYRDVRVAGGRAGLAESTAIIADASHRFTSELSLYVVTGYYWNQADEGELANRDLDEETFRVSPGLRYDITEHVSIEVSYTFDYVKNKEADTEAHRNLVFAWLRIHYPLLD